MSVPILNFEEKKGLGLDLLQTKEFWISLVAILCMATIGVTLATNVNLTAAGNDRVQFGQGVTKMVTCGLNSTQVTLTPKSVFVNANRASGGGAFYFTGLRLSDIPSECIGTSFKFAAYRLTNVGKQQLTTCAQNGLDIAVKFNGDDSTSLTDDSFADFGTYAQVSNGNSSSFDLNWSAPCDGQVLKTANEIYRVTVETIVAPATLLTYGGHFYQYVPDSVTWNQAYDAVEVRNNDNSCKYTYRGMCGYMVTITSSGENNFINTKVGTNEAWIGAADAGGRDNNTTTTSCGDWYEGYWLWVSGPEKCTRFSAPSNPINGVTVDGTYENWNPGEPNNSNTENAGQIVSGGSGQWNDLPQNGFYMGYVVEYSPGYTG